MIFSFSRYYISRKSISHAQHNGKKNPLWEAKNSRGRVNFAHLRDKNKKATLLAWFVSGSQRSLMICLTEPKIISSTSCLMNFSNIIRITLLSFIFYSLQYTREKGKFQSAAFMILPKKFTLSSCKIPNRCLHFTRVALIITIEIRSEQESGKHGGICHLRGCFQDLSQRRG